MSISEGVQLTCPNCKKRLRIKGAAAGKTIRCPNPTCRQSLTVPSGTTRPARPGPWSGLSPARKKIVYGSLAFMAVSLFALSILAIWKPAPVRPVGFASPQQKVEPPPARVTSKIAFHLVRMAGDDPGSELQAMISERVKRELTAAGFEIVPERQEARIRVDYDQLLRWYSDDASIERGRVGWVEHPQTHVQFSPRLRFWDAKCNCWFATYYWSQAISGNGATLSDALRSGFEMYDLNVRVTNESERYLRQMSLRLGKDDLLVAGLVRPHEIHNGGFKLRGDHGRGVGRVFFKYEPFIKVVQHSREIGGDTFFLEDRLCEVINEAGWAVTRNEEEADLVLAVRCTHKTSPCEYKCDLRLSDQMGKTWLLEEIAGHTPPGYIAEFQGYIVKNGVRVDYDGAALQNWIGNVNAPKTAERLTGALKDAEQSLKKK